MSNPVSCVCGVTVVCDVVGMRPECCSDSMLHEVRDGCSSLASPYWLDVLLGYMSAGCDAPDNCINDSCFLSEDMYADLMHDACDWRGAVCCNGSFLFNMPLCRIWSEFCRCISGRHL